MSLGLTLFCTIWALVEAEAAEALPIVTVTAGLVGAVGFANLERETSG